MARAVNAGGGGAGAGDVGPRAPGCGGFARAAAWRILGLSVLAGGLLIASRLILKSWEPVGALRLMAAAMPVPAFAGMMWAMVRAGRSLDELHARVQLEALAATVVVSATLIIAFGQAQKFGYLAHNDDMALAWPVIALTYPFCYFAAWRRYR